MTPLTLRAVTALSRCTFLPATFDKRFARDIKARVDSGLELTEKQTACLWRLCWKYRRQIDDSEVNIYAKGVFDETP